MRPQSLRKWLMLVLKTMPIFSLNCVTTILFFLISVGPSIQPLGHCSRSVSYTKYSAQHFHSIARKLWYFQRFVRNVDAKVVPSPTCTINNIICCSGWTLSFPKSLVQHWVRVFASSLLKQLKFKLFEYLQNLKHLPKRSHSIAFKLCYFQKFFR